MVIKTLDLDWIWIGIRGVSLEMLDLNPDPDSMNPDPMLCYAHEGYRTVLTLVKYLFVLKKDFPARLVQPLYVLMFYIVFFNDLLGFKQKSL